MATLVLCTLAVAVWLHYRRPAIFEMYVFNLKQGQAVLIRTPDDARILIDGGGTGDIIRELTHILPFYSRRIDAVIATNDKDKNIVGLVDVIRRYNVGHLYVQKLRSAELFGTATDSQAFAALVESANEKKVPIDRVGRELGGDSVKNSRIIVPGLSMSVYFPVSAAEFEYSKASSPSLVFSLKYGSTTIFFLGDASKKVQNYIVTQMYMLPDSKKRILMTSSNALASILSVQFMKWLQPENVIFSKSTGVRTRSAGLTDKKPATDPLLDIGQGNRFNIRQGGVKITIDADKTKITPLE